MTTNPLAHYEGNSSGADHTMGMGADKGHGNGNAFDHNNEKSVGGGNDNSSSNVEPVPVPSLTNMDEYTPHAVITEPLLATLPPDNHGRARSHRGAGHPPKRDSTYEGNDSADAVYDTNTPMGGYYDADIEAAIIADAQYNSRLHQAHANKVCVLHGIIGIYIYMYVYL